MRYLLLNSWLEQRSRLRRRTDGHPRWVSIVSESQQGNSSKNRGNFARASVTTEITDER